MEQIQRKHDLTSLTVKQLIERRLRLERLALTCEDTDEYCRFLSLLQQTGEELQRRVA
jgi:hypothetical protein